MSYKQITLSARNLSKDPTTKVAASLLTNENQIIGLGYNGMPRGFNDNLDFSRDENEVKNLWSNLGQFKFFKYDIFEHAERNTIFNKVKSELNTDELIAFSTKEPNAEDLRAIITSGIKKLYLYTNFLDIDTTSYKYQKQVKMCEQVKDLEIIYLGLNSENNIPSHLLSKEYKFFKAFEDCFYVNNKLQDFTIIIKKDFSVLAISSESDFVGKYKIFKNKISSLRMALYSIAKNCFDGKNYKLSVTMKPCVDCLTAIALTGIKHIILIETNVVNNNTNHAKWNGQFNGFYNEIIEKFGLTIVNS